MKTQIIALEAHDDFISVRDRMSWAKSPRILLVWPKFEKIALRAADLRILQQHASFLGAELGIITRRGDVRRDAERFGIPVFGSAAAAQREAWRPRRAAILSKPGRKPRRRAQFDALREAARPGEGQWRSRPLARVGFFAMGVLAVLAIAAVFVPQAQITLMPVSKQQTMTLPARAGTSITAVTLAGGLPAHELTVTVSATQSAQVLTQSSIPDGTARGIARFTNLTQSDMTIPAGTIVYSLSPSAVQFATLNDTQLVGSVNAIVEVPIAAVEGGARSNLPANAIQAIEGSLSLSAAVTNPQPTEGGSDRMTVAPSDADRQRLRDVVLGLLKSQALTMADGSVQAKDLILPDTLKMEQVDQETYDPPAGHPGSLLKLTMRAEFGVQYVKAEDLTQLAEAALNGSKPQGFSPIPNSMTYRIVGPPTVDPTGAALFQLQLGRKIAADIDLSQASALVRGRPEPMAAALLRADLPLAKPPVVRMTPSWWPWMPLIPFRTVVTSTP
ncbi:MAG TPA: baseplate J/gp47 family protein [Anaerolineales bacterium]